ncbi:MAG: DNA polymerase domain-containing protein [Desulfosporosinus sp.]|nr:DNA polymerase domain-containing protein [Desulfosporosinus sp.]
MNLPHLDSPSGCHFVDPSVRRGLLAQIEEELMAERDEAKRMAKVATDPGKKGMYNNRQNKIKLICNSVYGILSASGGRFVRVALGLAVTSQGRLMIMKSKEIAESPQFASSVVRTIYGDTDSIMVQLKPHITTDEEAFVALVYICDAVTAYFATLSASKAVLLQAEKIMKRMILINKKRYIAAKILATRIEREPGADGRPGTGRVTKVSVSQPERIAMGVEIARRDNCLLVKESMEEIVDTIMLMNDLPGARVVISNILRELIGGRIDIGKLVVSKSISKADYKSDPIQVQLAKRMKERDPSYEWGLGERIPYVIVSREHRVLADQAEDPLWAIQHGLPLDTAYYINKQLSGPISRIFMWFLSDKAYLGQIAAIEQHIRLLEDTDWNKGSDSTVEIEKAEKQLDKVMEKMQEHAATILFGPGALAAHPRKLETGKRGIAGFFSAVPKCKRCKISPVTNMANQLCSSCQPGSARCLATGCHKSVTASFDGLSDMPDLYCMTCKPQMGVCGCCGRNMPLISEAEGLCENCIVGKCYACGKENEEETKQGLCPDCFVFVSTKKAGMAAASTVDIEDLKHQADQAKLECFNRCGVLTDEINCVSRECSTLFKRATLAARIANMS